MSGRSKKSCCAAKGRRKPDAAIRAKRQTIPWAVIDRPFRQRVNRGAGGSSPLPEATGDEPFPPRPTSSIRDRVEYCVPKRITSIGLLFDRIEIVFERLAKLGGQAAANSTRFANFPGIRCLA